MEAAIWIITGVLIFTSILYFYLIHYSGSSTKTPKRPTILLVGLSGSGKTALFNSLRHGGAGTTFTSVKENQDWVSICPVEDSTKPNINRSISEELLFEKKIWLIDLPGNLKARIDWPTKLISTECCSIYGVIFLLDTATISTEMKDCTRMFFDFLTEPLLKGVPFLVACNKIDLKDTTPMSLIRSTLGSELKKLAALKRQFVHLPSEASREVVAVEREEEDDDEEKLEAQCDYIENHILPLFTKSSSLEVGYAGNPCRPCKKIQFIELSVTTGSLTKVKHWILSLFSKLS